ncbi:MAG TPA: hypothetical protein VIS96_07490 [Terrimicrobiaceae bacterium]
MSEKQVPLAGDFTATWGVLLSRAARLRGATFSGLISPKVASREPKLFLMEPYDPDKTVLLMVHGLPSTALAWGRATGKIVTMLSHTLYLRTRGDWSATS